MPDARPPAAVTGVAAVSALGPDAETLLAGALAGTPAFAPVRRFDVAGRRVQVAATAPGHPDLAGELAGVVDRACAAAGLDADARRDIPLLLAVHAHPAMARAGDRAPLTAAAFAHALAVRCGLAGITRAYTSACVAASTAVADAAAMLALGHADRVIVAGGYLVDPDQFAVFDAGRALARDGQVRPFSAGRGGILLGDGVAAVVLETPAAAARRAAPVLAHVAGWGRAGDAFHVCQPRPDAAVPARAIAAALARAGVDAGAVGYVNAHGSGTAASDAAEAAALRAALGDVAATVPVSSTKSVHGQALEASGLLELVVTVLALRAGALPVNAGYRDRDPDCPLNVVTEPRAARPDYALSLNSAFGGANTALLVRAA
ncbi:beta-ketoacyl synthase N-terminal-like domain-containing protein [Luedemannella helvata]|uniref:Beta-ketoacyl synthase N-terminal-like domain-containing protein n=1 Tax=Luedemannella helvata TaxID=349315 RepID=A0ABN2JY23_9ACTN